MNRISLDEYDDPDARLLSTDEYLVVFEGSSVPASHPECPVLASECRAAQYARRLERAWEHLFSENLKLQQRIDYLERHLASDERTLHQQAAADRLALEPPA